MGNPQRLGVVLALLAVASSGLPPSSQPSQAAPPKEPGLPTGRVCALKDFGVRNPTNPRRSEDPGGFAQSGLMAEGVLGQVYTTSPYGGKYGLGSIFRWNPRGEVTVIYSFDGGRLGKVPTGGLTFGGDGYFYGTTSGGGTFGVGTIFRIESGGSTPEELYHFRNGTVRGLKPPCESGRCPFTPEQRVDAGGAYPLTAPVRDRQGNFYGVTPYAFNQQYGVLYRIAPPYDSTTFKTLCVFNPNLAFRDKTLTPYVCAPKGTRGGSVLVGDGGSTLYGTTVGGHGTLFKATPAGKVTTLHEFDLATGSGPTGLVQASDGKLYGTAYVGGAAKAGVIYRLDPSTGGYTVLSSFVIGKTVVGKNPMGGLVQGRDTATGGLDGYLYGATRFGGYGRGTLYRIKPSGDSLKVLFNFSMYETGRSPVTAPFQHTDGAFYGITSLGGSYNAGELYRLSGVDLPQVFTHAARFKWGKPATDEKGVPLKDAIVTVRTNVVAFGYGSGRTPDTDDGITVTANCRNPHIVQFLSREKISARREWLLGTVYPSSGGSYSLTTNPKEPEWHSDATGRKSNTPGGDNAYFDQGPGAGWTLPYTVGGKSFLTIFDQPLFRAPLFQPANQADPKLSQVWRANARDFVICNCEVVREVRWTLEKVAGKQTYKDISIRPADNSALGWINAQLKLDGFRAVP